MIKPTDSSLPFHPAHTRTAIPTRVPAERPIESLAAPRGNRAELSFHGQMVAAAEKEFSRLLRRLEPLLQPVG